MPQAAKAPTTPKQGNGNQNKAPETRAERKVIRPADYIQTAKELEFERSRNTKLINENRTFLRLLDTAGALDEVEGQWLDDFYFQKKRGVESSDEQKERTAKLRKEAREEVAKARGEDVPEDDTEDEDTDSE